MIERAKAKLGRDPGFKIGMGLLLIASAFTWLYSIVVGRSWGTSIHYSTGYRIAMAIVFIITAFFIVRAVRGLLESERRLDEAEKASAKANADYEAAKERRKQVEAEAREKGGVHLGELSVSDATALSLWLEQTTSQHGSVNMMFEAGRLRFTCPPMQDLLIPEVD
jgi:hypothetical protein